jgi:ATP-dependent DNA ligase
MSEEMSVVTEAMKFAEGDLEAAHEAVSDPALVIEQKLDGTRGLVVLTRNRIWWPGSGGRGALAHTAATQHLPKINAALATVFESVTDIETTIVLDGEIMIHTGEYQVFDLVQVRVGDIDVIGPNDALEVRRTGLEVLADFFTGPVHLVHQAKSTVEKVTLLNRVIAGGGEGVMLKHIDSTYQPGVRTTQIRKAKLVKTADVVVTAVNRPDPTHGSAALAVPTPGGMVDVGACSLIGKPPVQVGDVIEVAYLYWTGSRLYQPRMMRVRDDKAAADCDLSQFPVYSRAVV